MLKLGQPIIINLADKGSEGTHWTTALLRDGVLYYADPFGTVLNGYPPEEIASLGAVMANRIAFQRPSTALCGYYAICFALVMSHIDRRLSQKEFESALYNSIA